MSSNHGWIAAKAGRLATKALPGATVLIGIGSLHLKPRNTPIAQKAPALQTARPATVQRRGLGSAPLAQFGSLSHNGSHAKARNINRTEAKLEGGLTP